MTLEEIFNFIDNAYTTIPWWQSILIYGGIGIVMIIFCILTTKLLLYFINN